MSTPAKRIWREIVAGKPIDWFDSGSLPILQLHCENTARAQRVSRDLAAVQPGSVACRHLSSAMKTLTIILASSSKQLRLTVQKAVDTRSKKVAETGVVGQGDDDDLIGGNALKLNGNGRAEAV